MSTVPRPSYALVVVSVLPGVEVVMSCVILADFGRPVQQGSIDVRFQPKGDHTRSLWSWSRQLGDEGMLSHVRALGHRNPVVGSSPGSGFCGCQRFLGHQGGVGRLASVEWDQFEEKAVVVYKPKKISEERIQQLVADAGHDTDLYTATDDAYNGLEACCLYRTGCQGCSDRKKYSDADDDRRRCPA